MRIKVNLEPTNTFSIRVTADSLAILDSICAKYEVPRNELIVHAIRQFGEMQEHIITHPIIEESIYGKEGMTEEQREKHMLFSALKDVTNQPKRKRI